MTRIRFPSVARRVGPGFARKPRGAARIRQVWVDALMELLREGPQERRYLAMRLHVTDRRARQIAEAARLRGELVIFKRYDDGPGGTYRIATSRAEYEAWKSIEVQSRLGTFHDQLRALDTAADRMWPVEQARLAI